MIEAPEKLLTQNSELRKVGVWNWTIPAHVVKLTDGSRFNCCPNAGSCGTVCYAKFGTYNFSNVARRHLLNLEYVLQEPSRWEAQMSSEIAGRRFHPTNTPHSLPCYPDDRWLATWISIGGKAIRIHDAGDFFSLAYLQAWIRLATQHQHVLFYAYTKEVAMLETVTLPINFRVVYSYGGRQDNLIDRDAHRHADVFPNLQALQDAGYWDQEDNDLLAVTAPTTKIGIVANNLPVAIKRFNGRSMSMLREAPITTEITQ